MTDERLNLPSASSMERYKACPGTRILEASLREKGWLRRESSPEATLGERIHASLEGEPEELERKAQDIRDSCESLCLKARDQFFGREPYDVVYEQRIWYTIEGTPYFSARPDRVYFNKDRILCPDFKTLAGDTTEAGANAQLRTAVAILGSCHPEVERIGVAIIQPLVTHTPEIAVYDRAAIEEATIEILEIVDQTFWTKDRFAGTWCKFCPCRAFCSEARAFSVEWPLKVNVEALPVGQEGADVLGRIKIAKKLLGDLEDEYKRIVTENPDAIPGYWIGKGKQIRYVNGWKQARELCMAANPDLENGAELFDQLLSLPLGKLEQFADEHFGIHGREFDLMFRDVIATKQTKGSLELIPKKYLK
jgi:hypothetical protein